MKSSHFYLFIHEQLCPYLPASFNIKTYNNKPSTSSIHPDKALSKEGNYLQGILGCQDGHARKRMGVYEPEYRTRSGHRPIA